METSKTNTTSVSQTFIISGIVLLACILLFSIDKDTHGFTDLLKPGNLAALVVYFTPTFLLSLFMFSFVFRNKHQSNRLMLSLITGIPAGFTLVICMMLWIRA